MKSLVKFAVPVVTLVLLLAACVPISSLSITPTTVAPPQSANATDALTDTQWTLVSFGPVGAERPVIEGSTVTLQFTEESQFGGSGGCNTYGDTYEVQGDTLSFGPITSTLMACADENVMQQEEQYLTALASVGKFTLTDRQLTIWYDDGQGVLNFSRGIAATSTPSDVVPTATPTASSEVPTVTSTPADALPVATATPINQVPAEEATRIFFAPGATSTEIDATIKEHGLDRYVFHGQEGQVASVMITSPHDDVLLTVVGEDGTPLKRYQNGPPSWTAQLPATQDYFIHAVSEGPTTSYTLRVWIEPLATEAPERINFAADTISAQRSGTLPAGGGSKQYVLGASAGQRMSVDVNGYQAPVRFTIESQRGSVWTGEERFSEVYRFVQTVTLPATGDYVVTVFTLDGAPATDYDVSFTIDPAMSLSPSEPPERVIFASDAISAQRSSLLPSGPGLKQYVLAARTGQTMTVVVTSDDVPLHLTVEGPAGTVWSADPGSGLEHRSVEMALLPETGDYLVTLTKPDHSPSTNYTIKFTIQ